MRDLYLTGTRCPWPVRAPGGVLRCVLQADRCDQHRHLPRPLVLVADILWWPKPWWPNATGHAQDNAGRARHGLAPDRVDAAILGARRAISRVVERLVLAEPVPTCRVCGCTDEEACWPYSCWWVEPDLCSTHQPATSTGDPS